MKKIKLYKVSDLQDGTQRFQSQLSLGKDSVDYIMETDGTMKRWGYGNKGFNFYKFDEPYEIVSDKSDMQTQEL